MPSPRVSRPLAAALSVVTVSALFTAPAAAAPLAPPTGALVTISGTVRDAGGAAVPDASVHAARTDRFTKTDASGRYTLTGVPNGSAAVVAAKQGYAFAFAPRTDSSTVDITLPAQSTALPRAEYPRPDADRRPFTSNAWLSLNGTWSFDFDPSGVGIGQGWYAPSHAYGKAIQVPFPYQSLAAFGEQSLATEEVGKGAFQDYTGDVWYSRTFTVPASFAGQRTRLRIGAASWGAQVWLDGTEKLPYTDRGETELTVDLGALAASSTHTLVIRVRKPSVPSVFDFPQSQIYPFGRQDRFSKVGGVWQSVWIEPVGTATLGPIRVTPELTFTGTSRTPSAASATVAVSSTGAPAGARARVVVRDPGGTQVATTDITLSAAGAGQATLAVPSPQLWDIGQPNLYAADVTLLDAAGSQLDGVRNTFGLRKVERRVPRDGVNYQYVHLNNRPVFLRGVLDQGFNPWGLYTPTGEVAGGDLVTGTAAAPRPGSIVYDMKRAQEQGYNLMRTHVKLFEPAYFHWADKLGLLVWQEMPNWGRQANRADAYPIFERLLRDSLARDRNHPSVIIRAIFNEGWGVTGGAYPLQPDAMDFAETMVGVVRQEQPGILVVDNSACCENGHTTATDINDVHNGLSGYLDWTKYLDPFNDEIYPGSPRNFDRCCQSGQPWMISEFSLNRGHQPTNIGVFRSYDKMAGYASVQLADQEDESASQLTYDRQDRGPVFLDHTFQPRGLDLINSDDAVSILTEGTLTVAPGATLNLPVKISHFSDANLSSAQLRWKVAGRESDGDWVDPGVGGSRAVSPTRYDVTDPINLSVTLPANLVVGYVWVWVEAGGQTVAENLVTFDDQTNRTGAFDPTEPVAAQWSGGHGAELMCGPQHMVGFGEGYFDYTAAVPPAAQSGGTLLVEASSAEQPSAHDPFHATEARKFPTTLTVTVDGTTVKTVTLPDDPADPLGLASRIHGVIESGYGNHYGYLLSVPLSGALLNGKTAVTVRLRSNGGGLRVFGLHAGTTGMPPQILPGTKTVANPPVTSTVDDHPYISLTQARLSGGTGTAVVSVVNGTNTTLTDTRVRLDLPSGWSARPVGSATVGTLAPAAFAHVAFTVTAPSGADDVPATATATWTSGGVSRAIQTQTRQEVAGGSVIDPTAGGGSLSGDGKAEFACVQSAGTIHGWRNNHDNNFSYVSGAPWDWALRSTTIGDDMADPARVRFADLDGDGRTEIIYIQADGTVQAWHNAHGFGTMPWGGAQVIATGFTDPARVRFADLNADRKAEIIAIQANGNVEAWLNVGGFTNPYSGGSKVIGTDYTDPARVQFADLDGDRKAEIINVDPDGNIRAWRNVGGYADLPYNGGFVVIGTEFTDPAKVRFPDLQGDGKADIVSIENGGRLRGWRNELGYAATPWRGQSVIIRTNVTDPARLIFP